MRRLRFPFLALAGALLSAGALGGECAPPPDPGRAQYVVGYGSLMQEDSRSRASPHAGPAHPVEISGYRRGWFARGSSIGPGTTYLGAVPERDGRFNAVIYRVSPEELAATDAREASYCRSSVALADIEPLEPYYLPASHAQAWIYVSPSPRVAPPDARHPIAQSYVDVFVSGCLELEQRAGLPGFSRTCLSSTSGWSEHWVNDRIHPRRPFVFQPRAAQIDGLLSGELPQYFSRIRIESGG